MQENMDLITTTKELKELVDELMNEEFVTIDTEFIREFTYYPNLCLIQIAPGSGGQERAIDPMSKDLDLMPLKKLLRNKKVIKVLHAAEQDIEMFFNEIDTIPAPLFDTQIAGQVLGFGEAASYATLVKDICGKTLDKSSRLTDWSRRPLSEKQVSYALSDVTYLRDIYREFQKRLQEQGREKWIEAEYKVLSDPKRYKNDPKEAWERFKSKHSSATFIGILKELARWREETAQKENVPRNRIMRDDIISEIAAEEPLAIKDLQQLRRVHERVVQKYGEAILKAVKKGKRFPVRNMFVKKRSRKVSESEALFTLLRVLLKRQCEKHNVAQKMVATIDEVKELTSLSDKDIKKCKLKLMHGWRYEVFGRYAQKLMRGELALMVEHNTVNLLELDDGDSWD